MDTLRIRISDYYKPEVEYICHVVFNEFLGVPYVIDWYPDRDSYHVDFHDSSITFPNVLFSMPEDCWLKKASFPGLPLSEVPDPGGLLSHTIPVLYGRVTQPADTCQVDILGSIFFMLTRYEEIDADGADKFGRYRHEDSVLYKANLLRRPLVNEYLEVLKARLRLLVPSIVFKKRGYQVSLSHDVDVPITYNAAWKDTIRQSLGDLRFRKSPGLFLKRYAGRLLNTMSGSFSFDPNNNFDFIMDAEEETGISGLFNFIPLPGTGVFDSNYDIRTPFLRTLLRKISNRGFEIGFHPGYETFVNRDRMKKELDWLNQTLEELSIQPVRRGRQHYLRWANPATWRIWDELGLQEDSSVGYGMINGFRAGSCYKYSVFDLQNRKHLKLVEEPLIVMDVNSDVNANCSEIIEEVRYFERVCRLFQGNFTLLYHNNYIISGSQKETFKSILKLIS